MQTEQFQAYYLDVESKTETAFFVGSYEDATRKKEEFEKSGKIEPGPKFVFGVKPAKPGQTITGTSEAKPQRERKEKQDAE